MRSIRLRLAIAILAAALLGACRPSEAQPVEGFRGTMSSGCAPHDAASTVLELRSESSDASVWFNLWPRAGVVPPTVVRFEAEDFDGQAMYCTSPEQCSTATRGMVRFETDSNGGIRGSWKLDLENGGQVEGTFQAEWLLIQALCG